MTKFPFPLILIYGYLPYEVTHFGVADSSALSSTNIQQHPCEISS